MRFLVDEDLYPKVAEFMLKSGHDAVHVRDLDAAGAPDSGVMALAAESGRVTISADTDYGALLDLQLCDRAVSDPGSRARRSLTGPACCDLVANLDEIAQHLLAGAVVAFTKSEIRVRPLPLR